MEESAEEHRALLAAGCWLWCSALAEPGTVLCLPSPYIMGQTAQKCQVKNNSWGKKKKEEEKACRVLPVNTVSDTELMGGLCGISIYIPQSDFPRQKDTNRTFRDQSL